MLQTMTKPIAMCFTMCFTHVVFRKGLAVKAVILISTMEFKSGKSHLFYTYQALVIRLYYVHLQRRGK